MNIVVLKDREAHADPGRNADQKLPELKQRKLLAGRYHINTMQHQAGTLGSNLKTSQLTCVPR
eukprot:1150646-Pelagomonas_calceolata.AAC.6